MNAELVLKTEHLSKKFCRNMRQGIYYGAQDILRSLIGIKSHKTQLRQHEFWALQDINFELKRGEALGVLGVNGSGKSTLLRVLAGIYPPNSGQATIRGRLGALIALGAGFQTLMTGRENIFLNGTIIGMSRREIEQKFDEIVQFADIGEFLDAPVKTYSSGMLVRLGFAIAIHAHPDLLLVDEVLAVGDVAFQKKCYEKVLQLLERGTTILFVSHDVASVERLCTKALLLNEGKQMFLGSTREGIQKYFQQIMQTQIRHSNRDAVMGIGGVEMTNIHVYQEGKEKINREIEFGKNIVFEFAYRFLTKKTEKCQVRIRLKTLEGRDVQKMFFHEESFVDRQIYPNEKILELLQEGTIRFTLKNPKLFPQVFNVDIGIAYMKKNIHLCAYANAAQFTVTVPNDKYFEYGHATITEFDYETQVF